jgi:FkbM family methyltransferase
MEARLGLVARESGKLIREVRQIRRFAGTRTALRYLSALMRSRQEIIRTGRLAAADHDMSPRNYLAYIAGTKIVVPGSHFGLARELYGRMPYFAHETFRINANDKVIDLGANCGLFSVLAAKAGAYVCAVEAQWGFVEELHELAELNDVADRISIEWAMVGSRRGDVSDPHKFALASHRRGKTSPDMSIGEVLDKHRISRVDFLKIDIEGSEFDLFTKEDPSLARIDKIAMEIHLDYGSIDEVLKPLRASKFDVILLSPEARRVKEIRSRQGYLLAWRD